MQFDEIVYKVGPEKRGLSSCQKRMKVWSCEKGTKMEEKVILKGITGMVLPGEMLAMLGPSGSGKTTLLNLLSGRVKFSDGSITYNSRPYTKSLKRRYSNYLN